MPCEEGLDDPHHAIGFAADVVDGNEYNQQSLIDC